MTKLTGGAILAVGLTCGSCSLATGVQRNTPAIEGSTAAIATNTRAVADSTSASGNLVLALALWAGVTFAAMRFAIISAARTVRGNG